MEPFLPAEVSLINALLLVFAAFFTSGLTAAVGIGGGVLMLALMTYLLPIAALIPVHGLVQLGSNSSRTWFQKEFINWPVLGCFLIGSAVGAAIGASLFVELSETTLMLGLGLFILAIVWLKLPSLRFKSPLLMVLGGGITTFVSMFAGATGPLVAVFLNQRFSDHKEMVATHGATMVAQHGLKVLAFGFVGFAFWQWMPLVISMIISGFFGAKAGTGVMIRLPETTLKLAFKIVITLIAFDLIRRALA